MKQIGFHWALKMGRIYGPETLVTNQRRATLGNNPKVITLYCNPCGSLKSHKQSSSSSRILQCMKRLVTRGNKKRTQNFSVGSVLFKDGLHLWLYSGCGRWMTQYGAMVAWHWRGKTEVFGEKPVPLSFCPPKIPQWLAWDWTGASLKVASIKTENLCERDFRARQK